MKPSLLACAQTRTAIRAITPDEYDARLPISFVAAAGDKRRGRCLLSGAMPTLSRLPPRWAAAATTAAAAAPVLYKEQEQIYNE